MNTDTIIFCYNLCLCLILFWIGVEGRIIVGMLIFLPCIFSLLCNHFFCPQDLMQFDDKGNKTNVPDKERQIEALQLLFLILPPPNRNLLKLLLDLLYQTAKKQDKNKMSAYNLALMFAPHVLWPKNVSVEGKSKDCLVFLGLALSWGCTLVRLSRVQGLLFSFTMLGTLLVPTLLVHLWVIKLEGANSCNLMYKSISDKLER